MLARLRKATEDKDQGFTLIELLVVMIIIGILAAIAIPVFLNQRASARDTSTKADVSTVGKEIAAYYVDGTGDLSLAVAGGEYTLTAGAEEVATGPVSNGTALKTNFTATDGKESTTWCVALTNAEGKNPDWQYSAAAGLVAGDC